MNNNYHWQKHQTNGRLQARLQEAEIHRSLKQIDKEGKHPFQLLGKVVLLPASGIAALIRRFTSHDRSNKSQSIQSA